MGFLDNTIIRIKSVFNNSSWGTVGKLMGQRLDDPVSNVTKQQLLSYYRSWARIAIDKISERIGQVEFILYEVDTNGNKTKLSQHPLLDLLSIVNTYQSKQDFFKYVESFKLLVGTSPILKIRDKSTGEVKELRLLPPVNFEAVTDEDTGELLKYRLKKNKTQEYIFYDIKDIIFFKEFNPLDMFDGLSQTQTAQYSIRTLIKLEEWAYTFFNNGGIPPFMLSYKEKLSQENLREIKDYFQREFGGSGNPFEPIITSGGADFIKTGLTPKDVDLTGIESSIRDKVLGQYGVPKAILGIVEDVNRANMEASLVTFLENNIKPRLQTIIDVLNMSLVSEFKSKTGKKLLLDYVNPVPEDKKLDAEIKAIQLNWTTQNEIRVEEGRKELPEGNTLKPVAPTPSDSSNEDVSEITDDSDKSNSDSTQLSYKKTAQEVRLTVKNFQDNSDPVIRDNKRKAYMASAIKIENKLVKEFKVYGKALKKRIKSKLTSLKGFEVRKSIEDIYNDKQEVTTISGLLKHFQADATRESLNQVLEELGLDIHLEPSEAFQEIMKKYVESSALQISATTKKDLIGSLLEGIDNGEGINDLMDRVDGVMSNLTEYRAYSIAQTETTKLSNGVFNDSFDQLGVPYKEWFSLMDGRQREHHGELDQTTIRQSDYFKSGNSELMFPGDPDGDPSEVVNCRCRILPKYEDGSDSTN